MENKHAEYDFSKSVGRIDEILAAEDVAFEELNSVPRRTRLTDSNGFHVKCSALFIDLRNSSELPKKYRHPTLAKIYRAYISECVAVFNGNSRCVEVNIHGDAVWGVFDTPNAGDLDTVLSTAARLCSLIKLLNCRLKRFGMTQISAGVGMTYGHALMIKAGYKRSSIDEVVWMGDVVNLASNLASLGSKNGFDAILVTDRVYDALSKENQKLLQKNAELGCYEGNIVVSAMEDWYNRNCG